MATFKGSEWDQMEQKEAKSTFECQGGVPRPNFPIRIHVFAEHKIILMSEFKNHLELYGYMYFNYSDFM